MEIMLLFRFRKKVEMKKPIRKWVDRVGIISLILMIGCLFFDDGL